MVAGQPVTVSSYASPGRGSRAGPRRRDLEHTVTPTRRARDATRISGTGVAVLGEALETFAAVGETERVQRLVRVEREDAGEIGVAKPVSARIDDCSIAEATRLGDELEALRASALPEREQRCIPRCGAPTPRARCGFAQCPCDVTNVDAVEMFSIAS